MIIALYLHSPQCWLAGMKLEPSYCLRSRTSVHVLGYSEDESDFMWRGQLQLPVCSMRGLGISAPYIFKLLTEKPNTQIVSNPVIPAFHLSVPRKNDCGVFLLFFFSQPNTTLHHPSAAAALIYSVGGEPKWSGVYLTELEVQHSKTPPKGLKGMTIKQTCSTRVPHQAWRKLQGGKLHSIITVLKSLHGII